MEGRYVHIVADTSNLISGAHIGICHLALMGTTYIRVTPAPTELTAEKGVQG